MLHPTTGVAAITKPSPIRRTPGRDPEAELMKLRARFARVSRRIESRIIIRRAGRRWLLPLAMLACFAIGAAIAAAMA